MRNMKKLNELSFFESIIIQPKNELIEKAIAEGRIPIGYNCYPVPRPLLSVGKAFPVRMRAPQLQSTELADFYMSSVICTYSRALLETALTDGFDFLNGIIFAASCQHIIKCGHNMEIKQVNADKENFFIQMLDAPQKAGEPQIKQFAHNLKQVAAKISEKFSIDMSNEALRQAVKEHNQFNSHLQEISDLRMDAQPQIAGSEFQKLLIAAQVAPQDLMLPELLELKAALKKRKGESDYRARLLVVGSILDNPQYIELIEAQGAMVVADRYCFGSFPGLEIIPEDGDVYDNLARHYLQTCECPRMVGNWQTRNEKILQRVKQFNVDGVLIENMKFCDWWGYEILTLEKALQEAGIPVVRIEREYAFGAEGQFKTRVQAFIESIEQKKSANNRKEVKK